MKRILFWLLLICWLIPGTANAQVSPRAVEVLGTGTAGSAASEVVTVQGIASGTVIPVSGTITANAGTNLNTSALALDTSVDGIEALLGGTGLIQSQPFDALLEGGLTELIGIDEQVNTSQYNASIGVALAGTYSGEIVKICLYATEDDTGIIIAENATLIILDADPATATAAIAIGAAERITIIAHFAFAGADYQSDANGASNCQSTTEAFHSLATLYFLYFHEGATQWNSAAGDQEQLQFNFWYRRES